MLGGSEHLGVMTHEQCWTNVTFWSKNVWRLCGPSREYFATFKHYNLYHFQMWKKSRTLTAKSPYFCNREPTFAALFTRYDLTSLHSHDYEPAGAQHFDIWTIFSTFHKRINLCTIQSTGEKRSSHQTLVLKRPRVGQSIQYHVLSTG